MPLSGARLLSRWRHCACTVTVYCRYEIVYPLRMPKAIKAPRPRQKHTTKGGLTRETAYLYDDEEMALEERATKERCSKSEIMRRALRAYLGIDN